MELASLLAGEQWSDHPRCTHPVIAAVARAVNDLSSDDGRAQLTRLVPDVIGLRDADPTVTAALLLYCADTGLASMPQDRWLRAAHGEAMHRLAVVRRGGRGRRTWLRVTDRDVRSTGVTTATRAAAVVAALGDDALRRLLMGAVDRYHVAARERAAGRRPHDRYGPDAVHHDRRCS